MPATEKTRRSTTRSSSSIRPSSRWRKSSERSRRAIPMRLITSILLTLICAQAAHAQTPTEGGTPTDETWKRCRSGDPDARIEACRALISSGKESPSDLASAYFSRGSAYRQKGLFVVALEDFNAAIAANSSLADAYGERGITLTVLGRFNDAIPDFTKVTELQPELA